MITANEIKKIRKNTLGMTQYEFSVALSFGGAEIPEKTIQKWERGETSPSSAAESLLKLIAIIFENDNPLITDIEKKICRNQQPLSRVE